MLFFKLVLIPFISLYEYGLNGPLKQPDLCWGPMHSIKSIVWKFLCCIYSVRNGLMGLWNSIMTYVGGPCAP